MIKPSCAQSVPPDAPAFEGMEARLLLSAYVIEVSVDGLRPDAITTLGEAELPNFYRLVNEGAATDNSRTDYDYTETLPNHTDIITARPVLGPDGHGVSFNSDPGTTVHDAAGAYVTSVFDIVHDNGLRTSLYASKSKFAFFDRSWNEVNGRLDPIGPDNGRDKIDTYLYTDNTSTLNSTFISDMTADPYHYSLVHFRDPDTAGHADGWMSPPYLNAVKTVDGYLGDIFSMIETDPTLADNTNVIVVADHGGTGTGHGDATNPACYTIPFLAWGPDVSAAAELYQINPTTRQDPGTGRPGYYETPPAIRHGDGANLATDFLGLGPIDDSLFNANQDLSTVKPPETPFYAVGESTASGTVSGDFLDTYTSDNVYEALTEILVGKRSILEHTWTFSLTGGTQTSFYVEAYHSGTEDDFLFQYSTDGSTWEDLVTVTKTADSDTLQSSAMPAGLTGTVYVQVVDTNRANNKKVLDTLYVDQLYIGTAGGGPQLPTVIIEATDSSAAEEGQDPGQFTVSRAGMAPAGDLTVNYTVGGTAVNGTDYDTLPGSVLILDGFFSADVAVTPVDDSETEGSETVVLTIASDPAYNVGSPSSDTVTILDNDVEAIKDYAIAESTALGTVSGSYLDTYASDDTYEALTEVMPKNKDFLEHTWTFNVTGGTAVTFSVEAYHDGTEDDFLFQYSTDGETWIDMVTVTKTADDDTAQTFAMDSSLSGTVYVRVIDTNRSPLVENLDTLFVDEMFILSA